MVVVAIIEYKQCCLPPLEAAKLAKYDVSFYAIYSFDYSISMIVRTISSLSSS